MSAHLVHSLISTVSQSCDPGSVSRGANCSVIIGTAHRNFKAIMSSTDPPAAKHSWPGNRTARRSNPGISWRKYSSGFDDIRVGFVFVVLCHPTMRDMRLLEVPFMKQTL